MGSSILGFAFGGLLGGFLLAPRVLAWLVGLHATLRRKPDAAAGGSLRPWPIALLLHSGPWLLTLTVAIIHYVATTQAPEFLWALLGGLGAALVFLLAVTRHAIRPRRPRSPSPPLTPESFAQMRREFYLFNIAFFTIAMPTGFAFMNWDTLDREVPMLIVLAAGGALGGWMFAALGWVIRGNSLQVVEKRRRQRAERESHAERAGA